MMYRTVAVTPRITKSVIRADVGIVNPIVSVQAEYYTPVRSYGGTAHTIYFEFSDSTDTTITGYWDDSFISDAITATTPTYGSKTVSLAQLDGVTWYERSAETWETVFDGSKTPNSGTPYNYLWFDSLSDIYPTVGSTWKVTIDGTSYTCTAYAMTVASAGNVVCFGNPKYSGGTDDGSSIPANFYNAGWGALVGDTELAAVDHAIKIERLVTS